MARVEPHHMALNFSTIKILSIMKNTHTNVSK